MTGCRRAGQRASAHGQSAGPHARPIPTQEDHECDGPRARRQALVSSPRCPDLLVPRHVRINHMLDPPGAPPAGHPSVGFAPRLWGAGRICVAVEHDQRGGARRMCCREQRGGRERGGKREENRFSALEVVEHRGDAVGPLLHVRQRVRGDRVGCARARLVEEDQSTERCHRLEPALKRRQLRKDLTVREPGRDQHDVTRSFTRRAIGDAQVTVQRVARLREHGESLVRGRVRRQTFTLLTRIL